MYHLTILFVDNTFFPQDDFPSKWPTFDHQIVPEIASAVAHCQPGRPSHSEGWLDETSLSLQILLLRKLFLSDGVSSTRFGDWFRVCHDCLPYPKRRSRPELQTFEKAICPWDRRMGFWIRSLGTRERRHHRDTSKSTSSEGSSNKICRNTTCYKSSAETNAPNTYHMIKSIVQCVPVFMERLNAASFNSGISPSTSHWNAYLSAIYYHFFI